MEVVEDEDELPLLLAEVRVPLLEVHDRGVERQLQTAREGVQPRDLPGVAVHRPHREARPREQERVLDLLIESVDFDGAAGNLAITFRPARSKPGSTASISHSPPSRKRRSVLEPHWKR